MLPAPAGADIPGPPVAVFDPQGETTALLRAMKVQHRTIGADADLSRFEMLVVGKNALTVDGPAPRLERARRGLKVIVFEQGRDVLEKRLGFRVVEHGLRQVFPRVPDHRLLQGIGAEHLRDWHGAATLTAPRLAYELKPGHGPTVNWCDIPVSRVWRCGNRGNVASVLIEKPARGDFLPIVDGGFSLQYAPLLEYHEGKNLMIFCQLDVTGRTESEPAAERLVGNLLAYASAWVPAAARSILYAGEPAGRAHLESAGFAVTPLADVELTPGAVLVVGPGGGKPLEARASEVARWVEDGGRILALGLEAGEANRFLPFRIETRNAEHIAACFEPFSVHSLLAGVGSADVHNRDPRSLPLLTSGAAIQGDGVLAAASGRDLVFCQMAPWLFADDTKPNLKKTHRRASFMVSRLLANLGAGARAPILGRFDRPVSASEPQPRWRQGLYLDEPAEWDDPYRFFRW